MMPIGELMLLILLIVVTIFVGLPVLAYMVMKFGTAGYIKAKLREWRTKNENEK